ncbi:putative entry exclusion protein TrbK-alt [Gymnodinialimonas hymeniacidonis]|uniref:putative entry exclusion protein TrbK-alt n=1 Tax=Gymnodinialimonas hymeniacidonis TaxID=3126508 RepID=UPI0034C6C751
MPLATHHVLRGIAIGLGVLAAFTAGFELSHSVRPESVEQVAPESPRWSTLEQCRALSPEDYATDEDCRTAWDQSRRRFFGLPSDPAGTE